jgi:small subunit ribosomal protein S1
MIITDQLDDLVLDSETPSTDSNDQDASFADLLEEYEPEVMKRGQYVQGEILQINDNVILADVDAKRTAVVPPQDILKLDEEKLGQLSVGDEVTLYVLRTPSGDEDLLVSLNKGLEQQDWLDAKEHLENSKLLELEVIGHNKGGLIVTFGNLHGFVPTSQVPQLKHKHNQSQSQLASQKAKLIGQELPLKVIEVDRNRQRLILSAKHAQKEVRQQRLQELKQQEGETVTGHITNLVKFGAFVDVGDVEGLVHISEIDWQKVDKPSEFLTRGEEIEVLIQSVDVERERVQLSRKALLPSPWQSFQDKHNEGELIDGVITNVTDFGAFALITEGIEGLIHVSEMRGAQNLAPQDVLSVGDTILVRILSIDPERQRLALSQKRVNPDEEAEWIWQRQQQTIASIIDEEE